MAGDENHNEEPPKKKLKGDDDEDDPKTPDAKLANDDDLEDDDAGGLYTPSGKRRFFPRVKHLLTREWEYFLVGLLDALDQSGAPRTAAASHKISNAWYKAFDLIYQGIASDCSTPTGKNRFHKFKDKIVELWVAIEQHAPDEHPQKERCLNQLGEYRKACSDKELAEAAPDKAAGNGTGATPKRESTGKRATAYIGARWKHLDEAEALKRLPEPLQSLVHMRGMNAELCISGHSTAYLNVESMYDKALDEYLNTTVAADKMYEKCMSLVTLHRQTQSHKETRDITEAYETLITAISTAASAATMASV